MIPKRPGVLPAEIATNTTLKEGLRETYYWIKEQYSRRKQGQLIIT